MAVKYIPYDPNILEGQAVLDNFTRTKRILRYRDNGQVFERVQRGMPLYEMEQQELIGQNPNHNMLIRGECLSACAYLKDKGIQVDLVYIDPPFASGADYAKKVYIRKNPKVAEAIAQAENELDIKELKKFEEKMYGDVWDKERYLNWMYENLMAIKSIMSDEASIYVHLDWHIGHYVKILMDEIFGEDNFKNEIVWGYRIQGVGKEFWGRKHDTLFFYTKSADYTFTPEKEDVIYEKPFIDTLVEAPNMASLSERDQKDIIHSLQNNIPIKDRYKAKLFNKYYSNVYVRDVWDCDATKPIISGSSEYLDYKTQKPEALLERIIKASSDEGMLVADFFGGSGVTSAVANRLGRRFIHCDIGINSIQTTRDRLLSEKAEFEVMEIKDGVSLYRNPVQTMDKLKSLIHGLRNEDALDKFWEGSIVDANYGRMPVYLPNLMDSGTRLLDKPLMNRIIREALPDLPSDTKKVIVYYIDITNRDEIEQFIKEQNDRTTIEIELRDLKQFLDEVIVEDEAEWEISEIHDNLFAGWKVEVKSFHSDRVLRKIDEVNLKGQQQVLKQKEKGKEKEFHPIIISDEGLEAIEWISLDCVNAEKEASWHSDAEIKIDKLGFVIKKGVKTRDFWDATITCDRKPLRMKIRNICGDETIFPLSKIEVN